MREMRWNCKEKRKCFRSLCPKLGAFDECFPGKIGMSDVDGMVEIAGRFLFLEWKSDGGFLTTGQRIAFERLTSLSTDPMKVTVIVVCGDPEEMTVTSIQVFHSGKGHGVTECDFDGLHQRIEHWAARASQCRGGLDL
jgi:hypothetical protein